MKLLIQVNKIDMSMLSVLFPKRDLYDTDHSYIIKKLLLLQLASSTDKQEQSKSETNQIQQTQQSN